VAHPQPAGTYRGTKNTWLTVDKGELTAYRSPELRAPASRYGDPRDVLSDDWAPHLPGINAPGAVCRLRQGSMENVHRSHEPDRRGKLRILLSAGKIKKVKHAGFRIPIQSKIQNLKSKM
jgi:hypothetical protein